MEPISMNVNNFGPKNGDGSTLVHSFVRNLVFFISLSFIQDILYFNSKKLLKKMPYPCLGDWLFNQFIGLNFLCLYDFISFTHN